jgi:protein SCO1/2
MKHLLLFLLLLMPAPAVAFNPFEATGIDRRPDAVVPVDLVFNDEAGRKVTLGQLSGGKPIVLVPVLHKCPNICGVTLAGLMDAVAAQSYRPGRDFTLVAFGIDAREKPAAAAASLADLRKRFPKLAADAHALTGDAKSIRAVTGALGYRYAWDADIGQYAHLAATAILTSNGHLSRWLYGLAPAANDLNLALTEAGHGRIGSWTDQLLLLCYHYDPATGRYSPMIWLALRLTGGATVLFILAFIAASLWRDRRRGREMRHG